MGRPNTPFDNVDFPNFISLIQYAYKIKYKHIDRTLEPGGEMYKMIAECLGRPYNTNIYEQFFCGSASISREHFYKFCRYMEKECFSKKGMHKYQDSGYFKNVYDEFKKSISQKLTIKAARQNHKNQVTKSQVTKHTEHQEGKIVSYKNDIADSDFLEIKTLCELFFLNLQQKEFKKAWARMTPRIKSSITYRVFIQEFGDFFYQETKNLFIYNFKKIKDDVFICDIFFEQAVGTLEAYTLFLQRLLQRILAVPNDTELFSKLQQELQAHSGDLIFKGKVAGLIFSQIKEQKATIEISLDEIYNSLNVDHRTIHKVLPLTSSSFVKLTGKLQCLYHNNRWLVDAFDFQYADSPTGPFMIPISYSHNLGNLK